MTYRLIGYVDADEGDYFSQEAVAHWLDNNSLADPEAFKARITAVYVKEEDQP